MYWATRFEISSIRACRAQVVEPARSELENAGGRCAGQLRGVGMADNSHVSGLRMRVRAPFDAVVRNRRIVGAALMALMLVACSRGAAPAQKPSASAPGNIKTGGTLTFVQRSDPTSWDIWGAQRTIDPTRSAADMVFSPLIIPAADPNGGCDIKFESELAESWKYLDPKTIEVKLRPGVKWHNKPPANGRDLTSDDVVFTFEDRFKQGGAGATFLGKT